MLVLMPIAPFPLPRPGWVPPVGLEDGAKFSRGTQAGRQWAAGRAADVLGQVPSDVDLTDPSPELCSDVEQWVVFPGGAENNPEVE